MTEYCEMRGVHDLGIEAGLHLAGVIHDDLTIGSVTTWQWWLAIAAGGYADGLIYAHPGTQKIEVTKRLWALAHYARFVQPGYQRVEATCTDTDLQVSAYTSPDEKKVVLVMINPSEEPKRLSLRIIQQEPFGAGAYWVTTDDSDMVQHDTDDETLSLPARSIATFVADQHQETDEPGNHP
jgi:O-glycosyl hydrolase